MPIVRLACWLLALISSPAFAADDLTVVAERKGEFVEVRARATLDAPLSLIWTTLTDYERLPQFIPGLKKSRVLSRHGSVVVVEQSGEARFLMFSFPIDVTLESVEKPPTSIRVRAISGSFLYLDGAYLVEPDPARAGFVLTWTGTIAPDVSLPPLIGEFVLRISLEDQFSGMVREIERRESVRRVRGKDAARP